MALNSNERNAISKALQVNGAASVIRVERGLYLVPSASNASTVYTVTAVGDDYTCTCQAAEFGRRCWHVASVVIRRMEEASKGRARVIGPVAAAPVAAAPRRTGRVQVAL